MRRLMQSFKQHIDLKNVERFSINEQGSEAICTEKINGHQGKQV